jgi:WD40 repeat protein
MSRYGYGRHCCGITLASTDCHQLCSRYGTCKCGLCVCRRRARSRARLYSSRGYYFASGGVGDTAALWTTDRMHPLRLFTDHFGDVHTVDIHPNGNYVVTGSSDRCVRVYDVLNGQVSQGRH